MFNSREYEWSDVTVVLAGRDVTGIRGISYSPAQEKEALYAKGNKPHSIQRGNKSYSGSVRLLQSARRRSGGTDPDAAGYEGAAGLVGHRVLVHGDVRVFQQAFHLLAGHLRTGEVQ